MSTFNLVIIVHKILLSMEPKSWRGSMISTSFYKRWIWSILEEMCFICVFNLFFFGVEFFCFLIRCLDIFGFVSFFFIGISKTNQNIGSSMLIIMLWCTISHYLIITLQTPLRHLKWWFCIGLHFMMHLYLIHFF